MWFKDWFQTLIEWRASAALRSARREIRVREKESRAIYDELQAIKGNRIPLLRALERAQDADTARVNGEGLVSLDIKDQVLRSQGVRVGTELTELYSSLVTATGAITRSEAKQRGKLRERLTLVTEERARAEEKLRVDQDKAWIGISAAKEAIEGARTRTDLKAPTSDSYVALWRQSKQSRPDLPASDTRDST